MNQICKKTPNKSSLPTVVSTVSSRLYLILLACVLSSATYASAPSDTELQRLTSKLEHAITQANMNIVSKELAELWDGRLTLIERKIESRLDSKERKTFAKSKQHWHAYRSSEVAFRAGFYAGGSIQPLIANTAYSQLTEHRVSELESLLGDPLTVRAELNSATNTSPTSAK